MVVRAKAEAASGEASLRRISKLVSSESPIG